MKKSQRGKKGSVLLISEPDRKCLFSRSREEKGARKEDSEILITKLFSGLNRKILYEN